MRVEGGQLVVGRLVGERLASRIEQVIGIGVGRIKGVDTLERGVDVVPAMGAVKPPPFSVQLGETLLALGLLDTLGRVADALGWMRCSDRL